MSESAPCLPSSRVSLATAIVKTSASTSKTASTSRKGIIRGAAAAIASLTSSAVAVLCDPLFRMSMSTLTALSFVIASVMKPFKTLTGRITSRISRSILKKCRR